ncbi:Imm53 family immunity protein [Streptomyces sp. NPDC090032]|uniref:Imm53 family immunity protein n=1 Tax=unclassified Streptomyces TaxID=2593676 RepID=UPI003723C48B
MCAPGPRPEPPTSGSRSPVEQHEYPRQDVNRSAHDWVWAWTSEKTFHARCGPGNLAEALALFRSWATARTSRWRALEVHNVLDTVQLRLTVGVRGLLPGLGALEGDAAAGERGP